MADTAIQWTSKVWNPTTGCDKVSKGCDNCYALTMAKRLKGMGQAKYQTDGDPRTSGPGFGLAMHPDALRIPLHWRKPERIFVNSMSDLFHPKVTDQFIADVFAVMAATPQHTYQILTKRPARMRSLLSSPSFGQRAQPWRVVGDDVVPVPAWPLPNVWMGVSVEDQEQANARIPYLLRTPAAVRWLSCEPLLGPINLDGDLTSDGDCPTCGGTGSLPVPGGGRQCPSCGYDLRHSSGPSPIAWVVTGGESGPNHRPADLDWFRSIRDQCAAADVAYFHKQHGGRTGKANGRHLDGVTHDAYPAPLASTVRS